MASFNHVTLVGNVTRDPENRALNDGQSITKFSLAITRKTKQGDETMFIDVVAWSKLGEICSQYVKKGMSVLIEGRLAIRKYDDKDGNKRTAVEVVANEMQMLGGKPNGDGGSQQRASATAARNDDIDDEIPF